MSIKEGKDLVVWTAAGLVAALVVGWAFPRLFPFYPRDWSVNRFEAQEIALERMRLLGDPVQNAYVVSQLADNSLLDRRLQLAAQDGIDGEVLAASSLGAQVMGWEVTVYPEGARPGAWLYKATLSASGVPTALRLNLPNDEPAGEITEEEATRRATALLSELGISSSGFAEPTFRRADRSARTDLTIVLPHLSPLLSGTEHGVEVTFAGDRLAGFRSYLDDPGRSDLERSQQPVALLSTAWIVMPYLLFPFVAFLFVRRYHEGEIGARRGASVALVALTCGALVIALSAKPATEGSFWGPLSRAQITWAWGFQIVILWMAALGVIAGLSWSVGEASCRERWGHKLAAFDALFQGRWDNGTVARSSLRGVAAAVVLTAVLFLVALAIGEVGGWTAISLLFGPWWQHAAWPGVALLLFTLVTSLYAELFSRLFLLPAMVSRLGVVAGGTLVAIVAGVVFFPPMTVMPAGYALLLGVLRSAVLVALFLRYDLLTSLLAAIGCNLLIPSIPFLLADDPSLQLQGVVPIAALTLPLLLSVRSLAGGKEFVYRYEDVPPHVRRIAERERQRVELETARQIQSSILPSLPPRLSGVDLAHAYLPASEVGGDFYDVLALADGRLAVAVGDVAGHGVASGLVMSMVKSALAIQVTFDPEVASVFAALNRMVYQAARQRLLTTLCYALVDPREREMVYASAGHISPYRVATSGEVEALDSSAYPLGVRQVVQIEVRRISLAPGDRLVLLSDGVVEARREGSDEVYGFERVAESLERHATNPVTRLRDGLLEDLARFAGPGPREDDQTILVLGLAS